MSEYRTQIAELRKMMEERLLSEDKRDLLRYFTAKNPNKHLDQDKRTLLIAYFEMAGKFGIQESVFDAIVRLPGCKVNARDANGHTALLRALENSASNSIVMKLIAMGADIRYKTKDGLGVLEALVDSQYIEVRE